MGAIKVFKNPKNAKMAMDEANHLLKIQHPMAVKILDYGCDGFIVDMVEGTVNSNLPYIRMEYVAGGTLDNVQSLLGPLLEEGTRYFLE
jgi:serine/threonine protein kinase